MNFYDIYFKSFFHRGRYPLPRRVPSAKNQDPSSLFANAPDVGTFSGTNCLRSIDPLLSRRTMISKDNVKLSRHRLLELCETHLDFQKYIKMCLMFQIFRRVNGINIDIFYTN